LAQFLHSRWSFSCFRHSASQFLQNAAARLAILGSDEALWAATEASAPQVARSSLTLFAQPPTGLSPLASRSRQCARQTSPVFTQSLAALTSAWFGAAA
jgi:hypothetical protein